jgi:hypothetical protein
MSDERCDHSGAGLSMVRQRGEVDGRLRYVCELCGRSWLRLMADAPGLARNRRARERWVASSPVERARQREDRELGLWWPTGGSPSRVRVGETEQQREVRLSAMRSLLERAEDREGVF